MLNKESKKPKNANRTALGFFGLITVTIVIVFGLIVGGYALINVENFSYRFLVEFKDLLRIETEVDKGE